MKKLLLMMIGWVALMGAMVAQDRYPVYCELVCGEWSAGSKIVPKVDFGIRAPFEEYIQLRDERDKLIKFKSCIDMLNYMAKRGWVYKNMDISRPKARGFIMEKWVTTDEQMFDGLNFRVLKEDDNATPYYYEYGDESKRKKKDE